MAKAKKGIKETKPTYTPPKQIVYFFVGEKYYKRLQPIPYLYNIPNNLKEIVK